MIEPKGDVKRLAKWAQRYITELRAELERANQRIKDLSTQHPGSNVAISGNPGESDITLPPNSRIFLYVNESRDRLKGMLEIHHDFEHPDRIRIATYSSRGISIKPSAANSFYIEVES